MQSPGLDRLIQRLPDRGKPGIAVFADLDVVFKLGVSKGPVGGHGQIREKIQRDGPGDRARRSARLHNGLNRCQSASGVGDDHEGGDDSLPVQPVIHPGPPKSLRIRFLRICCFGLVHRCDHHDMLSGLCSNSDYRKICYLLGRKLGRLVPPAAFRSPCCAPTVASTPSTDFSDRAAISRRESHENGASLLAPHRNRRGHLQSIKRCGNDASGVAGAFTARVEAADFRVLEAFRVSGNAQR